MEKSTGTLTFETGERLQILGVSFPSEEIVFDIQAKEKEKIVSCRGTIIYCALFKYQRECLTCLSV